MRNYLLVILFLLGLQGEAPLFSQNQSLDYCFKLLNDPKKVSAAQLCFIGMIETLERQNPPDPIQLSRAYAGLAEVYLIKVDLQTAKLKAQKALDLDRNNLDAILLRAQIALKEENNSEEKRWLLTADGLTQGKNSQVRLKLAKISGKNGKLDSVLYYLVDVSDSAAQRLYQESAETYYPRLLDKFRHIINNQNEKNNLTTSWFRIIGELKKYPVISSRVEAEFDNTIDEVIQALEFTRIPNPCGKYFEVR